MLLVGLANRAPDVVDVERVVVKGGVGLQKASRQPHARTAKKEALPHDLVEALEDVDGAI
eukprot:2358827-Lingulodinium_polyedra.AAC.1